MPFDRFIVLWNPATRKYKVIPTPMVYPSSSSVLIAVDQVGYDHVSDDYKVVRMIQTGTSVFGVLGGCLRVVGYRELRSLNVWVMGEYGVKESWSKLVTLTLGNVLEVCFSCETDHIFEKP
ncbi:hypothetical protein Hanom_Chr03g00192661 [Helianthus anomalus]